MTIEEFIAQQLDADEAIARTAATSIDGDGRTPEWSEQWSGSLNTGDQLHILNDSSVTRHIVRHDPTRVLRQVVAMRAQIEQLYVTAWDIDGEWGCGHEPTEIRAGRCDGKGAEFIERMLRPIARIWSDHPDFQPEWAPAQ